jgi:acyl-CoA synthetase (AMP-forming)/AMP-acid ligase II
MTELAGNVTFLGPDDHRRGAAGDRARLASAGRPGPLVEVGVFDDRGGRCRPGQAGEIAVHSDQVHVGYFEDPSATEATTFTDDADRSWFRTGDVGVVDDDGYLTIVDRLKDVIVTGGENVSSREVEEILATCPGVREVAVVGLADEHWGETVCAVVVTDGSLLTPNDVVAFARTRLAGFKTPRRVVFAPALPRNLAGKILKPELRAQLASAPTA